MYRLRPEVLEYDKADFPHSNDISHLSNSAIRLSEKLFSPLDAEYPELENDIAAFRRSIQEYRNAGRIGSQQAGAGMELYRRMKLIMEERERRQSSLNEVRRREMIALDEGRSEEKRSFFMREAQRQWTEYTGQVRPLIEHLIRQLEIY